MSALAPHQTYSDLEVDPRNFVEGQPDVHPQISHSVDPREEKIVQYEHRTELQPDGHALNHGGLWKGQIRKRRCGLSPFKFWTVVVLLSVIAVGAIVGAVVATKQQRGNHGRPVPSNSTGSLAASQLETIRQRYNVPGLAAGHIAANNLSSTAVGVRKQGNSQLLKSGDVFHLGACTATITAMLAAKFVDEGHLSWNTTLPEIYGSAAVHAMHQNTTIGMLSSSTAGIYSTESAAAFEAWWDDFRDESADPVMLRASFTSEVLARPPNTVPGTVYNFSTPGYMALASILERKTNRTWEDLTSELFSSMQMDGCGFGVQPESSRSAVENPWPHTASSSGPVPQIPDGLHGDNPSALWPALGVHCTLPSFARYLQIHLDGYHGRPTPILSRRSFDVLQSTWPVVLGHSPTYGGWSYDAVSANGTELYISGTNTMNYAWGWLLLEQDEAFLSFTNVGSEVGRSASAAALYSLAGYSDPPHGV